MVRHILKSGKEIKSVKGHIIKRSEFPNIYKIVEGSNEGSINDSNNFNHSHRQ